MKVKFVVFKIYQMFEFDDLTGIELFELKDNLKESIKRTKSQLNNIQVSIQRQTVEFSEMMRNFIQGHNLFIILNEEFKTICNENVLEDEQLQKVNQTLTQLSDQLINRADMIERKSQQLTIYQNQFNQLINQLERLENTLERVKYEIRERMKA